MSELEKPKNVKISVNLVWASIAISPFFFEFEPGKTEIAAHPELFIALVIRIAIFAFLNYKVSAGRNWARWVLLALAVWTSADMVTTVPTFWAGSHFESIGIYLAYVALQLAAMVLVFTKPGNQWFKRRPAENQGSAGAV